MPYLPAPCRYSGYPRGGKWHEMPAFRQLNLTLDEAHWYDLILGQHSPSKIIWAIARKVATWSMKPKMQKRKKVSHCQLTVVNEWKGRIMCKEYFAEWWWKDIIKISFSNVGLNIWECWDFQSMQKFLMELANWYLLKEIISQRNPFSSAACYWWSSLLQEKSRKQRYKLIRK